METACEYLSDKVMWVSTDEDKWKRRFLKWAEEYPEEVTIKRRPEENDGCLYLSCPATWLRIRPPIKRNMTEEQRKANTERLRRARESWKEERENDWVNEQMDELETDEDETEDDNEDA